MNTRLVRLSEPVYNLLRREAQKKSVPMSSLLALAVQAYTGGIPSVTPVPNKPVAKQLSKEEMDKVAAAWADDDDDEYFDEEGLPSDI